MYFNMRNIQWFGFLNILSAFIKNKFIRLFLSNIDKVLSYTILKYFFWQISGILEKNNIKHLKILRYYSWNIHNL